MKIRKQGTDVFKGLVLQLVRYETLNISFIGISKQNVNTV